MLCESPGSLKVRFGKRAVRVDFADGGSIQSEIFSLDNLKNEERLFEILKTKEIKTIHSEDASLEEIFIKVTGRVLQ